MDKKACVIEFHAFRNNNDNFIIKELVILDLLTNVVFPFMFEAPYSKCFLNEKAATTNRWMTKYFHRINWYDGFITYSNLHSIMFQFCKQYSRIYTRGLEKKNWIQRYTHDEVFNITIPREFPMNYKSVCCLANDPRHGQTQCAIKNAYRLAAFLKQEAGEGHGSRIKEGVPQELHQYCSRLGGGNITATAAADSNNKEHGFARFSTNIG